MALRRVEVKVEIKVEEEVTGYIGLLQIQ